MSEPQLFRSAPRRVLGAARALRAFFLPNYCPFCDIPIGITEYYCGSCEGKIKPVDFCEIPDNIDRIYACAEYEGAVRDAILRMKNGSYRYAAETFGMMLTECIGEDIADFDLITYVPSAPSRGFQLGYEHSKNIAGEVAIRAFKPLRCTLKILHKTSQQKTLTRKQRFENAQNMFEFVNKEYIAGKNILIVDDISTTGATLASAAKQLRLAGASGVSAAVFAKTMLRVYR